MRALHVPDETHKVLAGGAALAVSISGGKDTQAMLAAVHAAHKSNAWPGELFAIHSHLGRAAWPQSLGHCQKQADALGIELVVVRRPQGDMVDRWRQEMLSMRARGKDASFWSDSRNRYCTSDLKTAQIDKYLRRYRDVVCAVGIRAEESKKRSDKPVWCVRPKIGNKSRRAYTWNAVLDWRLAEIWEGCETSIADIERRRLLYREGFHTEALDGCPVHPAYVFGNTRLSCSLCVLASRADLRNGATHNPELYQILTAMERESGWSFRHNDALVNLFKDRPQGLVPAPQTAYLEPQLELDFLCC